MTPILQPPRCPNGATLLKRGAGFVQCSKEVCSASVFAYQEKRRCRGALPKGDSRNIILQHIHGVEDADDGVWRASYKAGIEWSVHRTNLGTGVDTRTR